MVGPEGKVHRPNGTGDTRFDLEIAAVICRPKKPKLKASEARECIFGYTLMQSWFTDDTFTAALGLCIVTADEFNTAEEVVAHVNGRLWSAGLVADATSSFAEQIVRAAKKEELMPGEIFGSGTIGRIHPDHKPPRTDATVEVEHPSIGVLTNEVAGGPRRREVS